MHLQSWCLHAQDTPQTGLSQFVQAAAFPEVNTAVQEAITALGGTVIPKLNWSCPKVKPHATMSFTASLLSLTLPSSFLRQTLLLQQQTTVTCISPAAAAAAAVGPTSAKT